jgi:hypothetical protein
MSNFATESEYLFAAAGGIVSLAVILGWMGHTWRKVARKGNQFLEDFYGVEARAGVPARPGVVERISNLETVSAESSELIKKIWAEQIPNHGTSQRDDISRIHEAVTGLKPPIARAYDTATVEPGQTETLESKGII